MKMLRMLFRNISNYIKFYNRQVIIGSNISLKGSFLEGKNSIASNSIFTNSYLGTGSYFGSNCHFNKVKIGKYCSFGKNIKVITGSHPSKDFVSTHPAFFSLAKQAGFTFVKAQKFDEILSVPGEKDRTVEIGNDVWIGDDVSIIGGVIIGNGAIIGTKALITKDIPSYSVVGGVPARVIKKRFSEKEIEFLLDFRWWDKDEKWITDNVEEFGEIKKFIEKFGKDEKKE